MRLDGIKRLLFVLVATVPAVFVSERVYWYTARGWTVQLEILAFYAPAVAAVLWLMSRYRVADLWSLMLVVPVFAYLVEGAIVPVLYSGGPMVPFFPAMFTFWHGMVGITLVLVMFRRWLLEGRWRPLLASTTMLGTYWGLWALTAAVPDDDPWLAAGTDETIELLSIGGFALYATLCTVALAFAHYLLNFLWLPGFNPTKRTRLLWLAAVALAIGGWTVAVPWAAPMFAAYAGLQIWALRRLPNHDRPTLLTELQGRFAFHRLWPLLALPITASISYAVWLQLDLSVSAIENYVFILSSTVQACIGLGVLIASHVRRIKRSRAVNGPGTQSAASDTSLTRVSECSV